MERKTLKAMWEYAKETDAYSEKTEKLLCWLLAHKDSATSSNMVDFYFETDTDIAEELNSLEIAARKGDGPEDLRNGFFVSEEEYINFINFCEKSQWDGCKWARRLPKTLTL